MTSHVTAIDILAGKRSDGSEVFEELLVEDHVDGTCTLRKSLGLVLGIASGDRLRLLGGGRFEVVARGGNICVQIVCPGSAAAAVANIRMCVSCVSGSVDGWTDSVIAVTIPYNGVFFDIEAALNDAVSKLHGVKWFYGNVYDPADEVTPLPWLGL